jgi:uncharacterized metal-binding protein YceD (DUF177 family)
VKPEAPIQRLYDLASLSDAGDEVQIVVAGDDLTRLTEWAGVDRVDRLEGGITLRKLAPNRFAYDAVLGADVVQSCVVTLEPVRTHIARSFARELHYTPRGPQRDEGLLTLPADDDEAPEEIASTRFDLAGPLLEEFSLAIDPYPRAPGVAFEPPAAGEPPPESPFAVLKRLKEKGG